VLKTAASITAHRNFEFSYAIVECDLNIGAFHGALRKLLRILFGPRFATELVLIFFSLLCRFFLDIDAARFYTFFNCSF